MGERVFLSAALLVMGLAWGLTLPLTRVAVSTGHQPLGLIVWQTALVAALLAAINALRGKPIRWRWPQLRLCLMVALLGTILPNSASYAAAAHLPAGVMAIVLSTVPIMAFPVALMLGNDRFSWRRAGGLLFGLAGVLLLIGPQASLPESAMVAFVPLALLAAFCYGLEGNLVALWGTSGLDAVQTLLGASIIGFVLAVPLALGTGQWISPLHPIGRPEMAQIAGSLIHALVYSAYVWLVGRAGPVFAVQVSYLVTTFGVLWSLVLLGESYSPFIWAALAMMMAGIFLVQPRRRPDPLVPAANIKENGPGPGTTSDG